MNVEVLYRNDPERSLVDPVLELGRRECVFRLIRGDYCDPFNGDWFGPNWPTKVIRWNFRWLPLPFIAWKWPLLNRACYIGAKVYGVDSPQYVEWMPAKDVYEGSQAFCFSIRPFANME